MSVFVDTSALYTLLVSTEEAHAEIVDTFRALAQSDRSLVTTNYILLETSALLQHRFGLDAVRDLEERVVPLLVVRWIDETTHRRSLQRLLRTDRRGVSLVDCSSFVVMDAEGIKDTIALDSNFAREGYRLLPGV